MMGASFVIIAMILLALTVFVWRARPDNGINRWFAALTLSVAAWVLGLAGFALRIGDPTVWARLTFASASLIPAELLAFIQCYPQPGPRRRPFLTRIPFFIGCLFALLSLTTSLVVYEGSLKAPTGWSRKTGPAYSIFAVYFLLTWAAVLAALVIKWRHEQGLARAQLRHLAAAITFPTMGAIVTNLLLPLVTGQSTYAWMGPYFALAFISLISHEIIRHRLMDLRVVVHHGLTVALAIAMSLVPLAVALALFWPRLSQRFASDELLVLLLVVVAVSLLAPPTRDFAGTLLDRYVYRTQANYQRIVRETSRALTRVLDLNVILSLASRAVALSTQPEGVAFYLGNDAVFARAKADRWRESTRFATPEEVPEIIVRQLALSRELIVTEEVIRRQSTDIERHLRHELVRLNWALVLPLLSEDTVIGAIVMGPKLSGDPFYPQDLDLLMTLANQTGIAVKNAQLYTEVVLAREYVENIVATIESGVVAVDARGRIAMFNRAAEQLTGLRAGDVKLRPVELLPAELVRPLQATIANGQGQIQPEIALPDGTTTRPVICTTSPLHDPAGTILGAVAVFSDLTPLKQLERERGRAERLAYFEILASSLAHEIKNPLVAIKTFAQLIPRRHRDEQFVQEFSRVVIREIDRMERLLERLRALSRPSDRSSESTDVRTPLRQAVEFLRPAFDEKRIAFGVSLGREPAIVLGDLNELEQLFHNLLINAHEATPPGGTVAVELSVGGQQVVVTIADSGPGIPAELLEHVFDPFITTKARGSGLGLTISAGIAKVHRAKLRADNRPDGGAMFVVEFPLAVSAEARKEVPGPGTNARA